MSASAPESKARAVRTVCIVDDDPVVREAILALLKRKGFAVRGFGDATEFLAAVETGGVACAILDFRLPGMSGLEIAAELRERGQELPIVFLSGEADIPTTVSALKLGAVDFLTKPAQPERLVEVVEELLAEAERLQESEKRHAEAAGALGGLTRRERDVMDGMLRGLQNKQIARVLGISHRTVEIHRARVMQKTHAANLLELSRLAEFRAG